MSTKLFCDICKKEIQPGCNMTGLLPKKNRLVIKGQSVSILLMLHVGILEWGEGEICQSCTQEAVDSYLRGVGQICRSPH